MSIVYTIIQRFLWLIAKPLFLFSNVEVHDPHRVLATMHPPVVFASTHKGILDKVYILMQFPFFHPIFPVRFMVETKQFKTPLLEFFRKIRALSVIFKLAGAFPSGRGLGVEHATDLPVLLAKKGYSIFVFPEGERIFEDTVGKFYRGAAAIAIKAGIPIVPISFRPQTQNGKKKIVIRFGRPFSLGSGTSYEVGTEMLREKIKVLYFEGE
ncbi:MAG: hypothetical protein COU47_00355 [Candidatus Niyogibacteria bacterium CG10_big_fil_rev_8_21_14_0_10_46_36]|uniref:Phospholipid/glycerol acyltransferase domain-containing protein n=1 Tax=Candidatus Niyogibacteria bacterium CG10_big_fil_rev_8_21_14_0_10_46_36 TaxID=1974726 RepID=A0A2H0TE99_9BACT|nr:MAG: hypothetical protein COU47_00355 [Candidatus Niyogibacteria bacterium CG10_big_fil_rev_8_21_14_0_10_46_36]